MIWAQLDADLPGAPSLGIQLDRTSSQLRRSTHCGAAFHSRLCRIRTPPLPRCDKEVARSSSSKLQQQPRPFHEVISVHDCSGSVQSARSAGLRSLATREECGLSSGLSCHRSPASTYAYATCHPGARSPPQPSRTPTSQTWKAGWVHALAGSNPASSAHLTRHDVRTPATDPARCVRDAEASDPDCTRWPRSKNHDDATAAILSQRDASLPGAFSSVPRTSQADSDRDASRDTSGGFMVC